MTIHTLPVVVVSQTHPRPGTTVSLPDVPVGSVHPDDMPDPADYFPTTVVVYLTDQGEVATLTVDGGAFGTTHDARVNRECEHVTTWGGTVLHIVSGEFDSAFGRASVWAGR